MGRCRLALLLLVLGGFLAPPTAPRAGVASAAEPARVTPAGVTRSECFPVETLPAEMRPEAERLLLRLMDTEALYTMVGGMKPMSSGFAAYQFRIDQPDTEKLERARRLLSVFRCGDEYVADLQVFARPQGQKRTAHAFVAHRPTLARAVHAYPEYFGPLGITPASHPLQVLYTVEYQPPLERSRGLGYLYGYPRYAVDFFVEAQAEGQRTGKLVPRDFFQIPTHSHDTGRFVWAVPRGHQPTEEDRATREQATRILADYRERRKRYVGEGKPGIVALLRDWFDDGTGRCGPPAPARPAPSSRE